MRLTDEDARAALYCCNELIDRRGRAGIPVPDWMRLLAGKLNLSAVLAMSVGGHELEDGGEELDPLELIGTGEAAGLLNLSSRQVRRLATDLDGEIVCGRHVFHRATVIEYARARKEGRNG